MADIFHEVDEEVRRERLKKLWERHGTYFVALALLIVLGIGGWRAYDYWQTQKAAESGARFEAALKLAEQGKQQEAEAAFAQIAAEGSSGYRILARVREAAAMAPRDKKAAVAVYDTVAADPGAGQKLQDLAAIRAALILVDTAGLDEMQRRLEPLTAVQRTYRHSARELLALSAWRAGDTQAVRRWSDLIIKDAETPGSMRARVEALLALSGSKG